MSDKPEVVVDNTDQPELTVGHVSYQLGTLGGQPCVVIYNDQTDKTTVIGPQSRWHAQAMAAMDVLQVVSTPIPGMSPRRTAIQLPLTRRILNPRLNGGDDAA